MPAPEKSDRRQTAVLWPAAGHNDYGQAIVGEPEEIRVRWISRKGEAPTSTGDSEALAASAVVGEEIAIGSAMWLGTLEDWYGVGSGGQDPNVMQVIRYNETPDLKNRVALQTVDLARRRGKPSQT